VSAAPAPSALADLDIEQAGLYLRPDYYELLAWLRANDPVHRLARDPGMVLVSRYDDIREISRDPARFSSRHGALVNDPVRAVEPNDEAGSLLHLDPPLHADYRKLLNREFTPRAVAKMEATVRRIAAEAFDALGELASSGAPVDLVEHLALPIPVRVIAELIGMAHHPLADVRRWSDATIAVTDDPNERVMHDVIEFAGVLTAHVAERFEAAAGGSPVDDLIGLLAASQVGGTPLTPAQVELFCMTLMVAGNETTRSLISGGALALAEHPDQRAALAGDPAGIPAAVEECLRWVTPIQAFCRTATEDVRLGPEGTEVRAGDYLVLLYASGNRDESVFGTTADRFDVARPATPAHVAFGFGEHLCLGAALARLEARVVFEELLRRYPAYEIAGAPTYVPSTLTRSLETLPVDLRG
jgi:cytochrome P450